VPTVIGPDGQVALDLPEQQAPPPAAPDVPDQTILPFGEKQLQLFTPTEMGARADAARALRTQLRTDIQPSGRNIPQAAADWIDSLQATNTHELVQALNTKYDQLMDTKSADVPSWFQKLAAPFQMLNDDGSRRDLVAEQQGHQDAAQQLRSTADGKVADAQQNLQDTLDRIATDKLQNKPLGATLFNAAMRKVNNALAARDAVERDAAVHDQQAQDLQPYIDVQEQAKGAPTPIPYKEMPDTVPEGQQHAWQIAEMMAEHAPDDGVRTSAQDFADRIRRGELNNGLATMWSNRLADALRERYVAKVEPAPEAMDADRAAADITQPQAQPPVDVEAANRAAAGDAEVKAKQQAMDKASPKAQKFIQEKLGGSADVNETVRRAKVAHGLAQRSMTAADLNAMPEPGRPLNFNPQETLNRFNNPDGSKKTISLGNMANPRPVEPLSPRAAAAKQQSINTQKRMEQLDAVAQKRPPTTFKRISDFPEPLVRSQADKDMEALVGHGATAGQVLDFLSQHGSDEFTRVLARMMRRLGLNSTISFDAHPDTAPEDMLSGDDLKATYDEKVDHVQLITRDNLQSNVMHELLHAATHAAINKGSAAAQAAVRRLESIQRDVIARLGPDAANHYGLREDIHEFVAEAFSNRDFQKVLASIHSPTQKFSLLDRFKNIISRLFNLPGRFRSALDDVLQHGQTLMDEQAKPGSVRETVEGARVYAKMADKVHDAVKTVLGRDADKSITLKATARKTMLGFLKLTGIADIWGKEAPSLHDIVRGFNDRDVVRNQLNWLKTLGLREATKMDSVVGTKRVRDALNRVMRWTAYKINPAMSWDDHTWLHNDPNKDDLKALVNQANREWGEVKSLGLDKAYKSLAQVNRIYEKAKMATMLHEFGKGKFEGQDLPEFRQHPMENFQHDTSGAHDDLDKAEKFFDNEMVLRGMALSDKHDALTGQRAGLEQNVADAQEALKAARAAGDEAGVAAAQKGLLKARRDLAGHEEGMNDISNVLKHMAQRVSEIKKIPYFYLGRSGGYFAGGHFKLGENGLVDPAHTEGLYKMLSDAGFGNAMLQNVSGQDSVFMRVENPDMAQALRNVFDAAQAAGYLDKDKEVTAGPVSQEGLMRGVLPDFLKRSMAQAANSKAFEIPAGASDETIESLKAAKQEYLKELYNTYMDTMPDMSMKKVYAQRRNVHGADSDMLKSFQLRGQIAANGLSSYASKDKIDRAIAALAKQVKDAKRDPDVNRTVQLQQVLTEILTRRANSSQRLNDSALDTARGITHSFFLGLSVPYMLMQASQLPMLTGPELGKKYGHVRAFKAMAAVTGTAFKILAAIAKGDNKFDAIMTSDTLKASKLDDRRAAMLLRLRNRGAFDMNGFTREGTRALEGGETSTLSKVLRAANSTAVYAETFSRLVAALAADKLYDGAEAGRDDYAHHVVSQSMFEWGPWNTSRQLGKHGMFGAATPLMLSFTGYQSSMLEKLYREVANAHTDPEARKWLVGHAIATTALAGALGLPFAGAFAGAASSLANFVTGRDDYDVEASFRQFMASMLGKDFGRAMSKGLPNMLGIDMSDLGEGDLLPFSRLLTDRRKLEESIPDWAGSMMGGTSGAVLDMLEGSRDIAYGLPMQGFAKMLPHGMRDLFGAYRLSQYGYEDSHGRRLPLSAGASDVLMRAVGLDPTDFSEYETKKRIGDSLKDAQAERAGFLKQRAELAMNNQDPGGLSSAVSDMGRYVMDDPQRARLLSTIVGTGVRDQRDTALAAALGRPLGFGMTRQKIGGVLSSF
jgi:hypothetical protein